MIITTNRGQTFEADWALTNKTRHGANQLAIQLPGILDPADILRDLVGVEEIYESKEDGVCTTYSGYTLLASLAYSHDRSVIRLILERSEDR